MDLVENYCQAFDLATTIPPGILRGATDAGQLILIPVSNQSHLSPLEGVLLSVAQVLDTWARFVRLSALATPRSLQYSGINEAQKPLRICMNNLGGSNWGDCTPQARTTRHFQRYTKATLANNTIPYQLEGPDKV